MSAAPRKTKSAAVRPARAVSKSSPRPSVKTGTRARAKFPAAVTAAVNAALDKKAEDIVVLDLRKAGGFTDFFVICTGGNPRQIAAIADGVRETLKRDLDERPTDRKSVV